MNVIKELEKHYNVERIANQAIVRIERKNHEAATRIDGEWVMSYKFEVLLGLREDADAEVVAPKKATKKTRKKAAKKTPAQVTQEAEEEDLLAGIDDLELELE